MTDFTPTPEAVEAVAKALAPLTHGELLHELLGGEVEDVRRYARVAIAAFVEAEGLRMDERERWTICRDCTEAWPTETLRDGDHKPCDCGDGTGTYHFEVVPRAPRRPLEEA